MPPLTLTVHDETTAGDRGQPIVLEFLTDHITVRELIRQRVYQEVDDFNRRTGDHVFKGLVQPSDAEKAVNGFRVKAKRTIDWQQQYDLACEAFERNSVLVLIDNRQAESLDEPITITPDVDVAFLRLVPLVGG